MSEEKEIFCSFSNLLNSFFEAWQRTDVNKSLDEEHIRYQRPYNYYRNIKNSDGA